MQFSMEHAPLILHLYLILSLSIRFLTLTQQLLQLKNVC